MEVKFEGLKEFEEKLKVVQEQAPKKVEAELNRGGLMMKERAIQETPLSNKETNMHLRDNYVSKQLKYEYPYYEKGIVNDAPHYHLVERGHNLVKGGKLGAGGKVVGYVPGKWYLKKAVASVEDEIHAGMEELVEDVFKDLNKNG